MVENAYDYIIVGSGFGGSVAALRLSEKGYRVLVLEAGRRFRDQDFPSTNWNLRRFIFAPLLGLKGIMRLDFFKGLLVLSGAGVGGGSLVYANTLIEPAPEAFRDAAWPRDVGVSRWDLELAPFYARAKRMLGAVEAPSELKADRELRRTATELGYGDTFHPVQVGVYLGKPGVTVDDPFFGGEGPRRTGCIQCGGCMVGCRHNAKNTLVKNYLYLAERRGAEVLAETEAHLVRPLGDGGYEVTVRRPGLGLGRRRFTARRVVLAAGVLGTLRLLLRCREQGALANLSPTLGAEVRTNSEQIIGVRRYGTAEDYSQGLAIAAGVNPNDHTKIEAVRYPRGSDLMGLLSMPLVEGATPMDRLKAFGRRLLREPLTSARQLIPFGFAKETIILLVMQSLDSKLRLAWGRSLRRGGLKDLKASYGAEGRPPVQLPEGTAFAKALARRLGGEAGMSVAELLGMSLTAHILGGCPMGADPATSVIDGDHQVHGHPGLYVVSGAAVPANLGVNPSLTITAMAERAMSRVPAKSVGRIERDVSSEI